MNQSKEVKEKLLSLCQKIYPKKISEKALSLGNNSQAVLDFAKRNRLAHFLAQEFNLYPALVKEYQDYKKKLVNSLKKIKKQLGGKEFIIIKTFSSFLHLTSDVDVLVKDKNRKYPIHLEGKNFLFIHLENKISWGGADAISADFAWQNTQKLRFEGFNFLVPNPKLDVLIRIGHLPFEEAKIRLGELLYIYKQSSSLDWQILEKEAKKMGWPKTFAKTKELLKNLHESLFRKPAKNPLKFPYQLPLSLLVGGVIEKRAWRKIWGGRLIIKDRFLP